jgi:hypothetical protein
MMLLTIDFIVLFFKIHSGLAVISSKFNRNRFARYFRFSVVFYSSGLFKLILIDLALLTGSLVYSIPIYVLTMIYFMSFAFFLPLLGLLSRALDQSYVRVIEKEKVDVQRRITKMKIDQKLSSIYTKKYTIKTIN